MADIAQWSSSIRDAIGRVIYGKDDVIEKLLVALLCRGHVLLEDVPGVGKTILARAVSATIGGELQRVQCTPDLLPTDVLGVSVYNQQAGEFEFREGPIVTDVLLVDEINRATPRTQSALLEAMEERTITVDGNTMELPETFFMLATENPVEFEGTFPLPEAQKDRFFLSTRMGYPTGEAEREIMDSQRRMTHPVSDLTAVSTTDELRTYQGQVGSVEVDPLLRQYVLDVVEATRTDSRMRLGASPRASMALYRGAQALAAMRGRSHVEAPDIQALAPSILWKRISVKSENLLKGLTEEKLIDEILDRVAMPGVEEPA
jgi:MoxR-like ATPase